MGESRFSPGWDERRVERLIARFGSSGAGMPPPWVDRGVDGALMVDNGVTRATRIAKLAPGALRSLERLSELAPDVRFGQLIVYLSHLAIGPTNEAIWDMEEEQLLEAIRQHTGNLSRRQPSDA